MNEIYLTRSGIKYYKGDIEPDENSVFVFGSNPEGRHGAGAAKTARENFGAIYGHGEGLQGMSYAIPTKDLRVKKNNSLRSIEPEEIIRSIGKMYCCAFCHPKLNFFIAYRNTTEKSLNGYSGLEMMQMFNEAGKRPTNVIVSEEWAMTGWLRYF